MKRRSLLAAALVVSSLLLGQTAKADRAYVNPSETVSGNIEGHYTEDGLGGGAVWSNVATSVQNAVFNSNHTPIENTSEYGGAIYQTANNLTLSGSNSFTRNESYMGGAIANYYNSTVNIESGSTTFSQNNAVFGGALAGVYGSITTNNNAETLFDSNTAVTSGGAILHYGWDNTSVTNIGAKTEFNSNNAQRGGAIGVIGGGELNINGAKFTNNSTSDDMTIAADGGAISQNDGSTTVINIKEGSIFTGNTAYNAGGAIVSDAVLNVTGTTFTGNKMNGTLAGDTLDTANEGGGAIFMYDSSKATIINSTFNSNESKTWGGAISTRGVSTGAPGATSILTVKNSQFEGNNAKYGGAIATALNNTTITDSTFTDNTATEKGGAIYNSGVITLSGANTFSGNTANNAENDIYNTGTLNIGGTATLEGGINRTSGTVNITDGLTTIGSALNNQIVNVNGGELHLAGTGTAATNIGGSAITVANGAILNTIDGVINNYSSTISLANGAKVKLDASLANTASADTYKIADGGTVIVNEIKILTDSAADSTDVYISDKGSIEIADTVKAYTTNFKYTATGNGENNGKITLAKATGTAGLKRAADDTVADGNTRDNVTYTLTGNDTTTTAGNAIIKVADMTIQGAGNSDEKKVTLLNDLIVGDGASDNSTLTINEAKFEAGTTSAGKIVNNAAATLTIKDSIIGTAIDNAGTANIIDSTVGAITNAGKMYADPVIHTDRLVNTDTYEGEGDVFENITSTGLNGGAINNSGTLTLTKEDDTHVPKFIGNTAANGGAIYNTKGKVSDAIVVNISDAVFNANSVSADGGAIYNTGAMKITNSSFGDGTSANANNAAGYGGAIENFNGTLEIDGSTFKGNTANYSGAIDDYHGNITISNSTFGGTTAADGNKATVSGGAIMSDAGNVTIDNSTFANNTAATYGGAILAANNAQLTLQNGSQFNNNSVTGGSGGAIMAQRSTVVVDDTDFTGNTATTSGGAIFADKTNLTVRNGATFTNNSSTGTSSTNGGGAIYVQGTGAGLSVKDATFIGNTAANIGGAILTSDGIFADTDTTSRIVIDNVQFGDGTSANANTAAHGGAYFAGENTNITNSAFNYNTATGNAGALYVGGGSDATVINTSFTNNQAGGRGGAISTQNVASSGSSSLNITGATISGNTASTDGGAIWTEVKTVVANTNFTNNTATSGNGGAISHTATDSNRFLEIIADGQNVTFSGNTANTAANDIYNTGRLDLISAGTGDTITFNGGITGGGDININKLVTGENDSYKILSGTSITDKTISTAVGNVIFKADVVADDVNIAAGTLTNTAELTASGTLTNDGTIADGATPSGTLNINNGTNNGQITQNTVNIATGNTGFANNNTMNVETALNNAGTFNNADTVTVANTNNNANLNNTGTINSTANSTITADTLTNTGGVMNLTNAQVAIVYQTGDILGTINVLGTNPTTDVTDLSITGTQPNFAGNLNVGDSTNKSTLNLQAGNVIENAIANIANGSVLNVDDTGSTGSASVVLNSNDTFAGDVKLASGDVTMKNVNYTTGETSTTAGGSKPYFEQTGGNLDLVNATLTMEKANKINAPAGKMNIDKDSHFVSQSGVFTVKDLQNAGTVHSINGGYENHLFNKHIVGDGAGDSQADYTLDLYARSNTNKNYDQFGKDSTVISAAAADHNGTLYVADWTLNGDIFGYDAPIDKNITIDKLFKGSVAAGDTINFTSTNKEVFTPIGWYGLHSNGSGSYTFGLNRHNPGVYRGQVTTVAQYQNQLMIDDMLFNHTMLDQGFKGNDYIASNPNRLASATDLYPPYQYSRKDGGLWVKMYGTFERLNMNHGLDVGNNAYGTIIGADFGLKELKHGWQFMPTAYIAYNGAHQYWNGYGGYQNGGQLGVMGTWYKKNFMIGALAYGGVYGNSMSTPRGDDHAFNYFAGGSVKGAYNWRFAKDWSLQPNLLVAYNYFGQQNWHTDFGQMGMMSGMLHGINIAPGLNLIWEKETFSIYATIQYMYNVNQSTGGRAGHVDLPNVHMDRGYIQYGLGVNKRFGDRFSGFLQAVIRNVGRNGVGLQAGFQWKLGKGSSNKNQKGNVTPELKKTEITLSGKKIQ